MDKNKFVIPSRFIVSIFGELQPVKENPLLSKARLRIFYKYLNRNKGYISDEMADYIIQNIGGTPIVGWYDTETKDFKEHGDVQQTRPYGFVPLETNFAWEPHLDEDGIEREYACVDVMLFTGRYEEAKQIINKAHSMEFDPTTISGQWGVVDGQ